MGIGKNEVAQAVTAYFEAPLRDIEAELEAAAEMPLQEVRALYGEARVTNMETEVCRELALQRGAVIAVHATTILNEANRRRLAEAGVILLAPTTALNEVLRRLHASKGDRFHDIHERARTMICPRQEWKVRKLPYPQLDTMLLTVDEVAAQAIRYGIPRGMIAASVLATRSFLLRPCSGRLCGMSGSRIPSPWLAFAACCVMVACRQQQSPTKDAPDWNIAAAHGECASVCQLTAETRLQMT